MNAFWSSIAVIAICIAVVIALTLEFVKKLLALDAPADHPEELPEYERFLRRPMPTMTEEERRRADEMGLP